METSDRCWRYPVFDSLSFGAQVVQRSSHSSTVSCHCTEFSGLRTQWFSSGK